MLRSLVLFLVLLLLLRRAFPRTLMLELRCFRPPTDFSTSRNQVFTVCAPACREFHFSHSLPLGACANASDRDNLATRLNLNISASNPILHVLAYSAFRTGITVVRKYTANETFDLATVRPWPQDDFPLPPQCKVSARERNSGAHLELRAAWACRNCTEATTSPPVTLTTARATTPRPALQAAAVLPVWGILAVVFGIVSLLICSSVLLFLFVRRRKKKEQHTYEQPLRDVNRRSNNVYDMRNSQMEPLYEDLDRVVYEDPGTVYSLEDRRLNWDNDAYGARPMEMESGRMVRFSRV